MEPPDFTPHVTPPRAHVHDDDVAAAAGTTSAAVPDAGADADAGSHSAEAGTTPTQAQQLFPSHDDAVRRLRERYGPEIAALDVNELLALQSIIIDQFKQTTDAQLLGTPHDGNTADETDGGNTAPGLSAGDIARIAEEQHRRLYNFQCRVALLLAGWFDTIEARGATLAHRGTKPFKDAKDFIARLLGIEGTEVSRRLRIATANSTKPGGSKTRTPKIEQAMADGRIDQASANVVIDRLRSVRAAAKRAGATDAQADQLVATKEGELLAKALHASPDEVRRLADRIKNSVNRTFTPPERPLTHKQRQYEEGIRMISPLGDNHVRLDWVVTKWQYHNVLQPLQGQINNLRTEISRINTEHTDTGKKKSGAERITPADDDYEIPMLYDNRTAAQRWSYFILDILETGLVLNTMPAGQAQEELNSRQDADGEDHIGPEAAFPEDTTPTGAHIPGLGQLINVGPNVIVGMQFADLAGQYLDFHCDDAAVQSEIATLLTGQKPFPELYDYEKMGMDWATLRQMSCDASIIPAVLNSKGEPLDVGRSQRNFSLSIRRAAILRDGGCAFPGCRMPPMYSELHHIQHWRNGGASSLENCVMLCRFHHQVIHQTEVAVRLSDDQFPEFLLDPSSPEARWLRNHFHRG